MVERSDLLAAARSAFRSANVIHGAFVACAFGAFVAIVVLIGIGKSGMSGLGTAEGAPLAVVLAVVAAVELILGPRLSEMALRNAKAPPAGASYPPPVYQLLQANLLVSALALAVAVYGVVLALTWNGVVGLPFTLVSLVALVLQRPQWHRWQAHLGRAPREA